MDWMKLLAYLPAFLNVVIAAMCLHALLKLTKMRLDASTLPAGKENRRPGDGQPKGFWAAWAWVGINRLPELIIAGIAIPDIPVLVKLLAG